MLRFEVRQLFVLFVGTVPNMATDQQEFEFHSVEGKQESQNIKKVPSQPNNVIGIRYSWGISQG